MPRKYVPKTKRKIRARVTSTKRRSGYGYTRRRIPMFKPQSIVRTGLPRTSVVRLRYVDGFPLDPPASGLATPFVFRANSIYDPNLSGSGHQPMNRDMWANLYKRYTVIGAKCTFRVFQSVVGNSHGMLAGVLLNEDAGLADYNPATLMEQGLIRYTMGHATTQQNSGNGLICTKTFSAKKFFNVADISDNKDIGANQPDNPVRTAKFICLVSASPNSAVNIEPVHCVVTIDYIVMFAEPLEQPAS